MIFTRIRVGEIVNLGQWEKNPYVFFLCFIPTTFIKKGCWWLRQLWSWKWGGRTVSPHPHVHSTHDFVVHPLTQIFFSTRLCWRLMHFQFSRPSCCLFIHGQKRSCFFPHARPPLSVHSSQGRIVFHTQDFPGFYPHIFPLRIYGWFGCILPSRTDSWVLRCRFHSHPGWGTIISFPAWSMYVFPVTSFPKDELSFPHVVSRVHWCISGAVNFPRPWAVFVVTFGDCCRWFEVVFPGLSCVR